VLLFVRNVDDEAAFVNALHASCGLVRTDGSTELGEGEVGVWSATQGAMNEELLKRNSFVTFSEPEGTFEQLRVWDVAWGGMAVFEQGAVFSAQDVEDFTLVQVDQYMEGQLVEKVGESGYSILDSQVHGLRNSVTEAELSKMHEDLGIMVFQRNGGQPWKDESEYVVRSLIYHIYHSVQKPQIYPLVTNVCWLLRKGLNGSDEEFASLVERDVQMCKMVATEKFPSALLRTLRGVRPLVVNGKFSPEQGEQVFGEFLWNRLSGISNPDRFFRALVNSCDTLRNRHSGHAGTYLSMKSCGRVLANADDPLLRRFSEISNVHLKAVTCLDGHTFACGASDGTAVVVNLDTEDVVKRFMAHEQWTITRLAYCEKKKQLITSSMDSTCKVWGEDFELVGTFSGHEDSVRAMAHCTGDGLVVSGADNGTVIIWSIDDFKTVAEFPKSHQGWVLDVSMFIDNDGLGHVASASDDCKIHVWNDLDLSNECTGQSDMVVIDGHENFVTCVSFVGKDKKLLSGSVDRSIRLWQPSTDGYSLVRKYLGHTSRINDLAVAEPYFISSSEETIRLWSIDDEKAETMQVLHGHSDTVTALSIIKAEAESVSDVDEANVPPHARLTLVSVSDDKRAMLWELDTLVGMEAEGIDIGIDVDDDKNIKVEVTSMFADKTHCFMGCANGSVKVYNHTTSSYEDDMLGNVAPVTAITGSDIYLATGSKDHVVMVWRRASFTKLYELRGHMSVVNTLSLRNDFLVSGSTDKNLIFWNLDDGTRKFIMRGHSGPVNSLTCIMDMSSLELKNIVFSGSNDHSIRGWDLSNGFEIRMLTGHTGNVSKVMHLEEKTSKGCDMLVSASYEDGTVRVWDVVWGTQLFVLNEQLGHLSGLAVDYSSHIIYATLENGRVFGWNCSGEQTFSYTFTNETISHMTALVGCNDSTLLACGLGSMGKRRSIAVIKPAETPVVALSNTLYGPLDNPLLRGEITNIVNVPCAETWSACLGVAFKSAGYVLVQIE